MEKTIERGDPEKCQVDHKPSPNMGDSNSCCCGEPAHAESAEDRNREYATARAARRRSCWSPARSFAMPQSPKSGGKEADDVRTGLTQAGIVGIEWVLRCQRESHPRRH